jgi:NAD(P)H-dependent FMN reductase
VDADRRRRRRGRHYDGLVGTPDQVAESLLQYYELGITALLIRPLDRLGDDSARVVGQLAAADAMLPESPVYRGSFTGALKNLLDLTPVEALRSKPVGIVAMGATLHHYLGRRLAPSRGARVVRRPWAAHRRLP